MNHSNLYTPAILASALISGVLIVVVHPLAPLALFGALCVGALLMSSPYTMLLGFIMVLMLRPAEFVPALTPLQLGKLFSLLAVGCFVASKAIRQDFDYVRAPQNVAVAILAACVLISSLLGSDRPASIATFTDVFVKILILYVLIANLLDTPKRYMGYQVMVSVLLAGLGAYALVSKAMGTATIEGSRAALVGYLGDPNDLAMVLLMSTAFCIQGVVSAKGKARAAFILLTVLVVGGILATQSRGGLLGVMGGSYFIMRDKIKSRAVIGAGLAIALMGALLLAGVNKRASGGMAHGGEHQIDESAQGRLDAWEAGFRMMRAKPLFGVGFSRFADNYESYVVNPVIWGKHETHNAYIKCASEIGLPGFGAFASLLGLSLWGGWRSRQRLSADDSSAHVIARRALFPCTVSVLIASFFLSACWSWFIYMLAAQAVALQRLERDDARALRGEL